MKSFKAKSDDKYINALVYTSQNSDNEDGILKLRKKMLNREYQDLECQRRQMNMPHSPISESNSKSIPNSVNLPYTISTEKEQLYLKNMNIDDA